MKQEAVLIDRKNVADTLRINPSEFVPLPELFEDICKLKSDDLYFVNFLFCAILFSFKLL